MKRTAIPKRAVSCIVALALVVSCLLTSYAGSVVSFHGDEGSGVSLVYVTTNGGRVEYEVGEDAGSFSNNNTFYPPLGTQCTFTAKDTSSRSFLYWQDDYTERVYSFERSIQFNVASRMKLRAVFAKASSTTHVVTFINYGGTVMQKGSYTIGAEVAAPLDVKVPGFTFERWSKNPSEIANDPSDQMIYPIYTVNEESYTVTLTNEEYVSGAGTYSNFQTVVVKAEPKNGSGESFSYWKDEKGSVVSYENNYSFRINYNVTLTAVYGETVTPEPVIRITKVSRDVPDMKITFYAERSVPESYTLLSHGMLIASVAVSDSAMLVNTAGDDDTAGVRKVYGSSNELCGTYSIAKTKVLSSTEVTVRPFMIVQDQGGEQYVVYGDIVRTTNGAAE